MYLKVHDGQNDRYWYIHDIERHVVDQPTLYDEEVFNSEPPTSDLCLMVPQSKIITSPKDGASMGISKQRINCLMSDKRTGFTKEYSVEFNTKAFLCNDAGQTVESYFPNGRNYALDITDTPLAKNGGYDRKPRNNHTPDQEMSARI